MIWPEDFINKIICDNCSEIIKEIPDKSIDLILTDPPYGIGYAIWDILNLLWIKECKRILKEDGAIIHFAWWSNVNKVKYELEKYFILKNWIIWDRIKGRGMRCNLIPTREDILWFTYSDNYCFNKISSTIKKKTGGFGQKNKDEYRKLSNVWTDIPPIVPWSKERVKHPTQKPIKLIERIIQIFSNSNDLILDPFLGSGTTAVACQNLNRNFIGIEINLDYCKVAEERLKNENE